MPQREREEQPPFWVFIMLIAIEWTGATLHVLVGSYLAAAIFALGSIVPLLAAFRACVE